MGPAIFGASNRRLAAVDAVGDLITEAAQSATQIDGNGRLILDHQNPCLIHRRQASKSGSTSLRKAIRGAHELVASTMAQPWNRAAPISDSQPGGDKFAVISSRPRTPTLALCRSARGCC